MQNQAQQFNPNWWSSPGNTIQELLSQKNLSEEDLAHRMGESSDFVRGLIRGLYSIDERTAKLLSSELGSTSKFWINREQMFRKEVERLKPNKEIHWVKNLPIREMVNLGWIEDSEEMVAECYRFFGVNDPFEWESKYSDVFSSSMFRKSSSFLSDISSTAAWLRIGEIRTERISHRIGTYNEDQFISTLDKIRTLTRIKDPSEFLPLLQDYCARCGVSVVVSKSPEGCKASGAARFISEDKAMILLSFRYLSDDHFWFTFFHEAGHLILHRNRKTYLEFLTKKESSEVSEEEIEANLFAGEMLVPSKHVPELKTLRSNTRRIISFAQKIGVSPGIVVGQMQFREIIKYSYLNKFKRRYKWDDGNSIISK